MDSNQAFSIYHTGAIAVDTHRLVEIVLFHAGAIQLFGMQKTNSEVDHIREIRMPITESKIRTAANLCISEMGDIFWDRQSYADMDAEYTDPYEIATNTIIERLSAFLTENGIKISEN